MKLSSHLRDCNGQDDWHPMSNYELWIIMNYIIYKSIWSCPLYVITCTHFILCNNANLLSVCLYTPTPPICCHNVSFFILFHYATLFVNLYDHMSHFITCTNFVLLNLLYLHIYMITHLMYDIFCFVICLLFIFLFFFMYYTYDTDICIYVFYIIVLDHLKPYASH